MPNQIQLTELTSPGCHNCQKFKEFWEGASKDFPNVQFREVSLLEPEGQEMVQKYSIFASPGIIINDELFSTGGVDIDKFTAKLKELS